MSREASASELEWRPLIVIFGVALTLRVVVIWELSQAPFFATLIGDSLGYHLWAERIAAGDWIGEGVFYQAPLYPYLLGTFYSLVGVDAFWAKLGQILLEAFSCVLLAGAGARLFESPRVGVITGALATCYAPAIFFTTLLQKATLSFFLTALALSLLGRIVQTTRSSYPVALAGPLGLLGITLGLLALARENALIFIGLIAFWLVVQYRRQPVASKTLATWLVVLILGASIPLVGVGMRNYVVGGDFTLTTSQFGTNFFIGNNANSKGFYLPLRFFRGNVEHERDDAVEMAEAATGRSLTPGEVSAFWTEQAFDYIKSQPGDWLVLMARKSLLVWNRVEAADTEDIAAYRDFSIVLNGLSRIFHFGVIVPLAAGGLWLSRKRWRELWLLYVMMAAYAASLTLFFLFARYRIPLVPITLLFAAVTIDELHRVWTARDWSGQLRTASVVVGAAILANLPLTDTDTQLAASYKNFATIMFEGEDYSTALGYFEKSLVFRPDALPMMRGVAESLANLGRFPESREAYERLLAVDPDHVLGNQDLGRVFLLEGRFEEGIAKLERASQLAPARSGPLFFLAEHYEGQGQISRARRVYLRILERAPGNGRARKRVEQIEQEIRRRKGMGDR